MREADGTLFTRAAARSASPRPRPSRRSAWRSRCSRCSSPSCAARCDARADRRAAGGHRQAARAGRRLPGRGLARLGADRARSPPRCGEKEFFLYIGRHLGMPVCLEGALKLKEISYIPTDSYAAGEMKHGPIALLAEDTPVVAVMNDSHVYEKVVSNVQEVRARGARVIAVITEGNEDALAPRRLGARRSRAPRPSWRRSWRRSRCRSWPTASHACAACRSTSRATWPRPSRSSSGTGMLIA